MQSVAKGTRQAHLPSLAVPIPKKQKARVITRAFYEYHQEVEWYRPEVRVESAGRA